MLLSDIVGRPRLRASAFGQSNYWTYGPMLARSDAGINVSDQTALQIGVVYRAINVLAHAVADVPFVIRNRATKARDDAHPQHVLLHDKPNAWQTSFRWRHLQVSRMLLFGESFNRLIPGPGGVGAIWPLPPETTRVVDQKGDGRLVYEMRDENGKPQTLAHEEVLHFVHMSLDGIQGLPLTRFAKNAMGLSLAAEKHGSMFLKRGATFSGVLSAPGALSPEARAANEKAWRSTKGGTAGTGEVPLLEGGMAFTPNSSTNKDSQWLDARTFQVGDLLRFCGGVPGVLVGHNDSSVSWASAEQLFLAFVTHSVMPITQNMSAETTEQVVTSGDRYVADFVLEGLLRGDIKTRYEAHRTAIMTGWETRAEAREIEGNTPAPEEAKLDEFLVPMNAAPPNSESGSPDNSQRIAPRSPQRTRDQSEDEDNAQAIFDRARLTAIAEQSARRLVRKEVAALVGDADRKGAARRFAKDPAGWAEYLGSFYAEHAKAVSTALSVPWPKAEAYCEQQRQRVAVSIGAVESFECEAVPALVELAIGG
jgi:HK97 family phage portal protein